MPDIREALEAAVTAAEAPAAEPVAVEPVASSEPVAAEPPAPVPAPVASEGSDAQTPPPDASTAPVAKEVAPAEPASQRTRVDRPPASWKGEAKTVWEAVPLAARQEISRRERMMDATLSETTQARKVATEFTRAVQPFQARIQSMGLDPISAATEMFKADYALSTAPMPQRAALMAKLIKDYGIDFNELDKALVGSGPVADPVEARVAQMLEQRLAPVQRLLAQQQIHQRTIEQTERQQAQQTVESMVNDPKFAYLEDVREDMADLIEIQAKRGVYLSLPEAYTRAVAMNPEISAKANATVNRQQAQQTAAQANAAAQRALGASVSVSGSPTQGGIGQRMNSGADLRGTIAAAFEGAGRI